MSQKKMRLTSSSLECFAPGFSSLEAFQTVYTKGEPAFYFSSASEDGEASNVTIIGLKPAESIKIVNGKLIIENAEQICSLDGNPITNLKSHLANYMQHGDAVPLPFSGGAVGFIGYDCVQYLEHIPLPIPDEDSEEACLFIFKNYIIYDAGSQRLKVIALSLDDGEKDKGAVIRQVQLETEKLMTLLFSNPSRNVESARIAAKEKKSNEPLQKQINEQSEKYRDLFCANVKTIKKHIKDGDIFQCVLSQPFELAVSSSEMNLFKSLMEGAVAPYYFYLDTGSQVIMGASPEMLVRVRGAKIQTCPIAGTRRRGATEAEDKKIIKTLLASTKEKAEHAMLVDLSRNDIGRISKIKTVRVTKLMEVRKYSHVIHLVSLVEGELNSDKTALDAFFSCFPAGTLSGAPKIRAMQIISNLEPNRRGFYGGAIVAADFAGNLDSCIAIRSFSVKGGRVRLHAGAGIVADSHAEREYQEVQDKLKIVISAVTRAESR